MFKLAYSVAGKNPVLRNCATMRCVDSTILNLLRRARKNRKGLIIANLCTGEVWQMANAEGKYPDERCLWSVVDPLFIG